MITRPNEYKHQNDNYAFVDNDNVRGGIFTVPSLITTNLLLIPIDKRSISTTIVSKSDNQLYNYFGADKEDINWGNITNWKNPNTLPTGFTNQPITPLSGNTVISQLVVNTTGTITGIVTKYLFPDDIGAADVNHIHESATPEIDGIMSSTDKIKLNGIESGAEVNQNAFSSISVSNVPLISALAEESNLDLQPGNNISIGKNGNSIVIDSTYEHPIGFTNQPSTALADANVISQVSINSEGHVTGVSSRALTPANIGAATSGHTHNDATTVLSGFMSALDKTKLNGVFSKVSVNSTQLIPLSTDATVNFVAGTNITLGTANNDIIINASSSAHPTGFASQPEISLSGPNVISQITVNDNGHVTGVSSRALTPANIGASADTHTHSGLIPSGGTTGQLLVKNSATDYDVKFISSDYYNLKSKSINNYFISSTSDIYTQIINTLPSNYNLQGKTYSFQFASNTTFNTFLTLDFSMYINGSIILYGSSNTVINLSGSGYGFGNGPIIPSSHISLTFQNLILSWASSVDDASFITGSSQFSGGFFTAMYCKFNFIGNGSNRFSLLSITDSYNIMIRNCVISATSCGSSYLIDTLYTRSGAYIKYPLITWYFINVSSTTNLTALSTSHEDNQYSFFHMYYKNISTLVPDPSIFGITGGATWVPLP